MISTHDALFVAFGLVVGVVVGLGLPMLRGRWLHRDDDEDGER
jgi:hypothetical protein